MGSDANIHSGIHVPSDRRVRWPDPQGRQPRRPAAVVQSTKFELVIQSDGCSSPHPGLSRDEQMATEIPFANVVDFGAIGTGDTNDGPAIQAAIDFMYNNYGGGEVRFPGGNFLMTSGVTVKGAVILKGM